MTFINQRLLDRVAYGFSGGPSFQTTRVRLISGFERRNAERVIPLHRFRAPYDNIRLEHHSIVIATYNACLGPVHSFRFKNYADYQLDDVVVGTAVGGANETMQIVKPYAFGGFTTNKPITKPVDSTAYTDAVPLAVTADDVPISFAVDYTTGILTFTVTGGETIRVTGEFDIPVFFDEDQMEFDYNNWEAQSGEIVLIEDLAA